MESPAVEKQSIAVDVIYPNIWRVFTEPKKMENSELATGEDIVAQ